MAAKKKVKLINVSVGERVNYVMKDGTLRPLDIVKVWNDQGYVNGILLVDGSNDDGNIPFYGDGDVKVPTITQSFDPHVTIPVSHVWVTSVFHDEAKHPGTWHFGETEVEEEDAPEQPPAKPATKPTEQPAIPATAPAGATAPAPNGGNGK